MWTTKNRRRYDRSALRYPSDLTDDEWAHVEPLIPPAKRGGSKRQGRRARGDERDHVYVEHGMPVAGGPEGFAAARARCSTISTCGAGTARSIASITRSTSSAASRANGSQPHRCHHRQPEREKRGKRGPRIDPHGYDAGKKIKGKKRHVLVDTLGLLLHAIVHGADIQDRDGGIMLLATLFGMHPFLKKLFADAAYQGPAIPQRAAQASCPSLRTEIVKRSDQVKGFVVLAQALDRRAHDCVAQPLPKACQGLGEPQSQGARVLAPRFNPPHAPKTLQSSMMFPDRL